jgi:hypothetical protein
VKTDLLSRRGVAVLSAVRSDINFRVLAPVREPEVVLQECCETVSDSAEERRDRWSRKIMESEQVQALEKGTQRDLTEDGCDD